MNAASPHVAAWGTGVFFAAIKVGGAVTGAAPFCKGDMDEQGTVLRFAIAGLAARLSDRSMTVKSVGALREHILLIGETWRKAAMREIEHSSGATQIESPDHNLVSEEASASIPEGAAGADGRSTPAANNDSPDMSYAMLAASGG